MKSEARRRGPLGRFWGHLTTITYHKWLVFCYCRRLGLWRQGLAHDLSKYSPAEFWPGVKYCAP